MPSDAEPLKFGDVVLVPFPFTDQSAVKRRPAVVISGTGYNVDQSDTILMPVTSQLRGDERPKDIVISDWEGAHLLKPSAIKPVIATIETELVIRKLGTLCADDAESLRTALAQMLG
ncbi:MAG: type II toxin-antitoxin system PemK/MazF family toxin [Chthoniobacteraceae bacterium]